MYFPDSHHTESGAVAPPERRGSLVWPNNQHPHRTSHAPKDVLHLRICADYCAPCQPLLRAFSRSIRLPPPAHFQGCPTSLSRVHLEWSMCRQKLSWWPSFRSASTSSQSGIKSPFSDSRCVLTLARIRRLVAEIKAVERDELLAL